MSEDTPPGRWFWLGLALGAPLIGIGVAGLLKDHRVSSPINFALWFAGGALLHDLVFAPLVLAGALLLRRLVPGRMLAAVQAALVLSGFVLAVALIPLRGWGRSPGEPTVQPLDYPRGVAILLVAIWAGAAATLAVQYWRRRSGDRDPAPSPTPVAAADPGPPDP